MVHPVYNHSPLTKSSVPSTNRSKKKKWIPQWPSSQKPLNGKEKWKNEGMYVPHCTNNEHPSPLCRGHQRSSSRASHSRVANCGSWQPKEPPDMRYPISGCKPNSQSTLPIQVKPNHGKSSLAHFVMMFAPLVCVDLLDVIIWRKFCQDIWSIGNRSKTLDSHPQAWAVVAHPPAQPLDIG